MTPSDVKTPILWLITLFIGLLLSNLAVATLIYFLVNIDLRTLYVLWLPFFVPPLIGWYIVRRSKLLRFSYPFREMTFVLLGLYVITWIFEMKLYLHNTLSLWMD